ncbi:hypothetical protein C8Q75DRAFT_730713 [Abortiporus biennis]|nr:hypothetical protein C8Q75DRAFT_730713 [Abortiporus biennis]
MFSFKKLVVAATLGFAAVASALTVPVHNNAVAVPVSQEVEVRGVQVAGIAKIIADLTVEVKPLCDKILALTEETVTVEVVTEIVADIRAAVAVSINDVLALKGQDKTTILAGLDVGVILDVGALAQVVAGILILVLGAVGHLLSIIVHLDATLIAVINVLCCCICEVLGGLVVAVIAVAGGLVGGLVAAVVALIGGVVGILAQLNVSVLVKILAL